MSNRWSELSPHPIPNWPTMSNREFYENEYVGSKDEATRHSEMYWGQDFRPEKVWADLESMAENCETFLEEDPTWDWEEEFWQAYKNDPDKGLS